LLLACAASAGVGVRAWEEDADRAWLRLRAQADSAADALVAALREETAALADAKGGEVAAEAPAFEAIVFVARADGVLVAPAWAADRRLRMNAASRAVEPTGSGGGPGASAPETDDAATERKNAEDAALFDYYDAELVRAEREGGVDAAATLAREFLSRPQSPPTAAALLTASAALERRAGRLAAAREAWARLAEEYPRERDSRGALRALMARLLLLETGEAAAEEAIALFAAVSADAETAPDGAYLAVLARGRALASRAAETASPALRERFVAAGERIDVRRRERDFRLLWREGVAIWLAEGAQAGARSFGAAESPWVFAVTRTPDGGFRGGAREAAAVLAAAQLRPAATAVVALGMKAELGPTPTEAGDVLVDRPLGAAWPAAWRLRVVGADVEGLREAERRKFLYGALAAGCALLIAAGAAFATVRAVDREVRAADDREMFVAATTHELKTPLAAIKLLAELTPDPELPPERREEFARRIGSEADRLARLVSAVLDFARLERESPADARARFRATDLRALVRETADAFRPVAQQAGFDVAVETPEHELRCDGDAEALRGALLNLLDNAVKYAGPPHAVTLRADAVDGRARLVVADRGPGVPAAERARIFRPFVRSGDELVRERPGAGLGLALVARTATLHGGGATVRPRAGGGAEFELILGPVRTDAPTTPNGSSAP
jgi:signal transduction histidine kinase